MSSSLLSTISVSAADPSVTVDGVTYEFGEVITVDTITAPEGIDTESRVLMSDGKTYPAFYIVGARNSIYKNTFVWTNVTKEDGTAYSYADIIMLEIPSNVNEMGNDRPLEDMDNAVYVSVPSITSWKNEAHFSGLDSLVVMDLSRATKMTYMTRGFVMDCPKLTTVIWPTESSISSIARGAFAKCTSLTSIVLPEGITSMGEDNHNNPGAFENCTALESITLPSTLTFIGKREFLNCSALTSIEIPSSVSKICREAFQNCKSLTAITCKDMGEATATNIYIGHDNFSGCTALTSVTFLQDTVTVDSNAFSGHSNVTFNIKALSGAIGQNAFKNCDLITSIDLSRVTSLGNYAFYDCDGLTEIRLPLVTSIGQQTFYSCDNLVNVQCGTNLTKIYAEAFRDCKKLVFVDFGTGDNALEIPAHRTFRDCTSLKAVSLPKGAKGFGDGTFAGCTNLQAFYLGESITYLAGNKSDSTGDGPCFGNCSKLYFVQEPFSVTKADGTFYTADEFVQPAKPLVYFFPSTLKQVCGAHNVNKSMAMDENGNIKASGADDLAFVGCTSLNSYLVFPEGFTGIDDRILTSDGTKGTNNEEHRGDTLGYGLFHKCATADNPITLVFLGKIDRLSFDRNNNQTDYLTYMFANPANTGFENTQIASYYGNANYKFSEMYVVFCHAEGGAQRYKVGFVGTEADKTIPVLTTELVEGGETHVANPKMNSIVTIANCVNNATAERICLCGFDMGVGEVEGSALGHSHTIDVGIVYENYMADGNYCKKCERCDDLLKGDSVGAIFVDYGYSMTEGAIGGKLSMTQFFGINKANLDDYTDVTGNTFEFGFVVSSNNDPMNAENSGLIAEGKTYITDQSKLAHDYFAVTVVGFTDTTVGNALTFCVYVKDGDKVSYLDNGETVQTVEMKSYNEIKALLNKGNTEVTE